MKYTVVLFDIDEIECHCRYLKRAYHDHVLYIVNFTSRFHGIDHWGGFTTRIRVVCIVCVVVEIPLVMPRAWSDVHDGWDVKKDVRLSIKVPLGVRSTHTASTRKQKYTHSDQNDCYISPIFEFSSKTACLHPKCQFFKPKEASNLKEGPQEDEPEINKIILIFSALGELLAQNICI